MAQTKEKFFEEFLNLCKEKDFTKISVTDIIERCNTTRQTFYYHFKNIDEMVDWAFKSEIQKICSNISSSDTWQQKSPEVFRVISKFQPMIKNALNTNKASKIITCISNFIGDFVKSFIEVKDPNHKFSSTFLLETLQYTVTGQIIHEMGKEKPDFDELCTYICKNVARSTNQ